MMPRSPSYASLNSIKSKDTDDDDNYISLYPYSRVEECTWQADDVSNKLTDLLAIATESIPQSGKTALLLSSLHRNNLDGGGNGNGGSGSGNGSGSGSGDSNVNNLVHSGWTTQQARYLRLLFGSNVVNENENDDNGSSGDSKNKITTCCGMIQIKMRMNKILPSWLYPICSAFTSQFHEPLNIMLLASGGISLLLGQTADAVSIGVALTIVSLVAAVQEYRSEAALEKLNDLVPHTCTVMRDGKVRDGYKAKDLVVGDLIVLSSGDRVPADCRLIDAVELSIDESSLTGENTSVSKHASAISIYAPTNGGGDDPPIPLTEQKNIAFMGTLVCSGRGRALVVGVGSHTEFGKIAKDLTKVESQKSPLQRKIDELGKILAYGSSIMIALMAVLGWVLGRPFLETVTVAVSLAVAAIPEGLPICVTVTLALGVLKMARSNAIVKKLTSVETLGCATVVASDKTGTLTQNEMTARSIYTLAFPTSSFGLTGVGYETNNGYLVQNNLMESHGNYSGSMNTSTGTNIDTQRKVENTSSECSAIQALFAVASISNNATISSNENGNGNRGMLLSGQPTELALLVGAAKSGVPDPRPQYHRLQEIPFTSERKRMEIRARPVSGKHTFPAFTQAACCGSSVDGALYFVKGMPESILGDCKFHLGVDSSAVPLSDKAKKRVLTQSRRMASSGLRVLAMAYGATLDDLIFVGLVGMEDPPRKGVAEAVTQLQKGGVSVLMVTGDSKETAIAIAKRCGIIQPPQYAASFEDGSDHIVDQRPFAQSIFDEEIGSGLALSGKELDAIPPSLLAESIIGIKVFYRVAPRHKMALVRALQGQGEIVAMTGDGVNDAIALKAADIGVAMGKEGTDVAKEAADVVLADDDFSTIVKAVAGGKGIFFNIRNFLAFQLSTSFAALGMECVATVLGLPNPLNAMQILWINIIMDGPPAQSLGVEPVDKKVLLAKPRRSTDPVLTKPLLLRAVTSAILILFLTLRIFALEMGDDGIVTRRDTTMTFMTFVNCDLFNAYVCRSADRCFYEMDPFGNSTFLWAIGGSIVGQLAVIYFKPLQEVFKTEALSASDILFILLVSSSVLMLDTIRKKFFSRWFSDSNSHSASSEKKRDTMVESNCEMQKPESSNRGNRSQQTIRSRAPITL